MKRQFLAKLGLLVLIACFFVTDISKAHANYVSRFEAITFTPAMDNSEYFSAYSSQNLKAGQGNLGFYLDFANRPLQFVATGGAVGRQSVIDNLLVADVFGAMGFTDWFEIGLNVPIVAYNWFFTDNAAALSDHAAGMGDLQFMMKFRVVDSSQHRVGFAVQPFVTLPTGDVARYTGNGAVTGGINLITDFIIHERFNLALNLGATMRDDVTRNGVRIDDQFNYGIAGNIKIAKNWRLIIEAFGKTNFRDFFTTASSPFEAGGGFRYIFGETGFSVDFGATAGIIDGVGAPRVRGFAGLTWTSPAKHECPECPPPAPPPDPRIQGDKIVIWGKIFYDTDKATIKPISYPVLDDVVDVMQKHPELHLVEVQGHTDARASDSYNQGLSDRRSHSAMEYLISKGIESSRLTSKGYGESKPIADNTTKEGMSQNRRTEFLILERD